MRKRILSILFAICMVLAMMPVMPATASAADTCTCLIKCTEGKQDRECPVCAKTGATVDSCTGRVQFVDIYGDSIVSHVQLKAIMTWPVTQLNYYYFLLENNIKMSDDSESCIAVPQGADVVIDLNGKTLDGNQQGTIFEVSGKLTIIDSVGGGKIINATEGAFHILEGGSVLIKGKTTITIENCTGKGGVIVESGGSLEMDNVKMTNNIIEFQGKSYCRNLTIKGSSIVNLSGRTRLNCCDQDTCSCTGNNVSLGKTYGTGGTELIPTLYVQDDATIIGTVYNEGTIAHKGDDMNAYFGGHIENFGTISAGPANEAELKGAMFDATITNHENGLISGGNFYGDVKNSGLISGGIFQGDTLENNGSISGGFFKTDILENNGSISDGIFSKYIINGEKGSISDGQFQFDTLENNGSISGGEYVGTTLINGEKGLISGGIFKTPLTIKNTGTVSGGTFYADIETAEPGTIKDSAMVPVYFVTDTGKVLATVKVLRGKSILSEDIPSVDPTSYGYNNVSWRTGGLITKDETYFYANFSDPITYNITYSGGGTADPANPVHYTVESDDITLNNPTENGYIFTGWSGTGLKGNNNMTVTIPKGSTGNKEYTAHFIDKNTYEVVTESDLQMALNNRATTIKLRADITLSSILDLSDRIITLDLNGYTLTGNIKVADISEGLLSMLTLIDSDPASGGVLKGNIELTRGSYGTVSWLYANGGTVTGKVSLNSGISGIYCTSDTPTAFQGYVGNYGEIHGGIFYGNINEDCIREKTVTFMNGDSRYALGVVTEDSKVLGGITAPTKDGWEFVGWKYGDRKVTSDTTYRELVPDDTAVAVTSLILDAQWKDIEAPVISGIKNGEIYCSAQTFSVSDNDVIADVTVNGKSVPFNDDNNQLTLYPSDEAQKIVVTDKTGNKAEMTVTVNDGHTCEWLSENGKYWQKCQYCGEETEKKDIPTITIDGADAVCVTQNYRYSFTLPEGATDATYGYDFETKGDLGLPALMENGEPYGVVYTDWYDPNQTSFQIYAGATTADGFRFSVSKTVALKSEHTDVEPKDHICDICDVTFSGHTGGTATCTSRAVCFYCGSEYGKVDSTKHHLEYIPAKAATVTETGNIEYWYCIDCEKCFPDKEGINSIELKDTVISKLPEIIDGAGQTISVDENIQKQEDVSFRSNADISDFVRVEVDGVTVDAENYTVTEGSTIITLKAAYVATLSAGKHTIGIVSTTGTAATTFTVNAKAAAENATKSPQTGDNIHMELWFSLLFVSCGLLTITGFYGKKKKYGEN
ncbi:MAG: hypothetical protein ACI4TK_01845 [Agathobacter sp.]